MSKRLCIVCGKNQAVLPDRERMGRRVARVCRECHGERLRGDLRQVMVAHQKQEEERAARLATSKAAVDGGR